MSDEDAVKTSQALDARARGRGVGDVAGAPDEHSAVAPGQTAKRRSGGARKRTAAQISDIMRRVHSDGTSPELRLRQAQAALGPAAQPADGAEAVVLAASLPGKPDLVFPAARLVVFVDGDLWHGNQWRRRGLACLEDQFRETPAKAYWLRKIRRNMRRDARATAALLTQGWRVIRLWESQINTHLGASVALICDALQLPPTPGPSPAAAGEGSCARPTVAPERSAWVGEPRVPGGNARLPSPAAAGEGLGVGAVPALTCAEFFAGIGLMRMGLEREGWSVTFANDIDERKHAMYTHHFANAPTTDAPRADAPNAQTSPSHTYGKGPGVRSAPHFHLGDIHDLPADELPTVTLATASFPCNDLSLAGARRGLTLGAQSSAFWGFTRILGDLGARRPPLVLLENVVGFLSSHGGADLTQALIALNDLGYVVDVFILDAVHFTPQSRQRLFIIGTQAALVADASDASDAGSATAPGEPNIMGALGVWRTGDPRPAALRDFIAAHPEVRWRIRRLPPQPTSERRLDDLLEDLPDDAPAWWNAARTQRLLDQMNPRHRALAEELIQGAEVRYGTIFRRTRNGVAMAELRADGVAGCLRTPRGGSARQIVFKGGKGRAQARLLTGREAARLMGADDYILDVSLNDALFGFGDAVCVPVISWIATYYLNPLVNELLRGRLLAPTPGPSPAAAGEGSAEGSE